MNSGIRAGGVAEVQVVSVSGTGEGYRNATTPDGAIVRGYWRAQFAASNFRYQHFKRTYACVTGIDAGEGSTVLPSLSS